MDKYILCLANSYKHGGRCIAGIEVKLEHGELTIVKSHYGIPIWIRPVSHSVAGEVPTSDARGIDVLSVVKIHGVTYAGNGSHSEDYYYQKLENIQTLNPSDSFLKEYTDSWHSFIFGNKGRALTPEAFERGDYSVMLIRTEGAEVYLDTRYTPKPRIKFTHNGNLYDFPITDPIFLDRLRYDEKLYHSNYGTLYIVVSLGVVHDGWHSKLAATIITPAISSIKERISTEKTTQLITPPNIYVTSNKVGNNKTSSPIQKPLSESLKENHLSNQKSTLASCSNATASANSIRINSSQPSSSKFIRVGDRIHYVSANKNKNNDVGTLSQKALIETTNNSVGSSSKPAVSSSPKSGKGCFVFFVMFIIIIIGATSWMLNS